VALPRATQAELMLRLTGVVTLAPVSVTVSVVCA
jgi:hypothetical protein